MEKHEFVGRDREMKILNDAYLSSEFQLIAIYGRRRIGKTSLISQFCKGKRFVYFPATQTKPETNLKYLSESINESFPEPYPQGTRFKDFRSAILYLADLSKKERLIFVIDEYPYLASSDPSIQSELQHLIDHILDKTQMMLILCGSSMSFMQRQVLGYESPLYGRRTAQIHLLPMSYREVCGFFPQYGPEEIMTVLAVTGGIPAYLSRFDEKLTVDENTERLFFDKSGALFEEPSNLLKQELRNVETYQSILDAIASGCTKVNEIVQTAHIEESGTLIPYLRNLMDLGIITKNISVTDNVNSKNTRYRISDGLFRFWYVFVAKRLVPIAMGLPDIYKTTVKQRMNDFVAPLFEEVSLTVMLADVDFLPVKAGRWWGTDPSTRSQSEIDAVAVSEDGRSIAVGECKYRDQTTELSILKDLQRKSRVFGDADILCYLFSKSDFTDAIFSESEKGNVRLFTLKDIYDAAKISPAKAHN